MRARVRQRLVESGGASATLAFARLRVTRGLSISTRTPGRHSGRGRTANAPGPNRWASFIERMALRESALEPPEDRQRAGEARTCRRQGHGREVHAEANSAAASSPLADLEDVPSHHLAGTIAIDFLTVPTVTFDVIYVFFGLSLEHRRVLHIDVTAHPLTIDEIDKAWVIGHLYELEVNHGLDDGQKVVVSGSILFSQKL